MRRAVVGLLVSSWSTIALADQAPSPPAPEDVRDVFGLGRKQQQQPPPGDVRDVFGLGKKPRAQEQPLDCSDGRTFGCVLATDPLDEHESIYGLTSWLAARYLLTLPVANATQADVASYALGAVPDPAGVSIGGASGLENRWLVEGAPADGLRTGAADTRLPLAFIDGIRVTAGGFTARDRASTGGIIDTELRRGTEGHELDARVWLGWTAGARQRPIIPSTYTIRRGEIDVGPDASFALVATGPIAALSRATDGNAWYALGLAGYLTSTKFTWTSQTLVDADNDGAEDGFPGLVTTAPVDAYSRRPLAWTLPLMARAGLDRGAHALDLTIVGTVATDTRFLFNSTLQAAGVDGLTMTGDAIATWRGRWTNTRARGQLAWHRSQRDESAHDPAAADIPQLLSAYVPTTLADDPLLAAACEDDSSSHSAPGDPYPKIINCPVPSGWFASGGAGALTDTTGDRPSLTGDIAHRIDNNVVRVGATAEDTRLVHETRFTGGTQIRSLFPEHVAERRFADPNATCSTDVALPCPTVDESELRYRTRYTAAYVEDTWHATPNLAFDAGLRWELMWVGTVLHFSDQLAPRLGLAWDPLGGGRSRVWTSMGRSYAHLIAGLGPTIIRGEKTVDRILSPFGEGRSVQTGAPIAVAPDVQPIAQDELTAGAAIALAHTVQLTTWIQGRWLRRGLETTPSGFDNPGRVGGTPAIRETTIVAAEVATAPTAKLVLRAGYMYGRSVGTWTGAFDPRQGAVLYAGSDFDTTTVNLLGRLPNDLGHRTYIEAQRSGQLGSAKLAVSLRLTAGSGRPRSVVGDSAEGAVYLLPRGTAGRNPVVTQANLRLQSQWRGFDITLDLFNVFDRREAVASDEVYTRGSARPIDGGTLSDLVFLKNDDGSNVVRRPGYAVATTFQSPLSVVLGIQRAF